MTQSVDYASMSLTALVAEWNTMVVKAKELQVPGTWVQVQKFKDKSTAISRCTKLCAALAAVVTEKLLDGATDQAVLAPSTPMVEAVVDATLATQADVMEAEAAPPPPTPHESALLSVMRLDGCPKLKLKANGKLPPHDLELPASLRLTPEEREAGRAATVATPVQTGTVVQLKPSTQTVSQIASRSPKGKAGPKSGFPLSGKITLLVDKNPKRPGSAAYDRFAQYESGMTVGTALEAGVLPEDLRWDTKHSFIKIEEK